MANPLLDSLNPDQLAAVTAPGSALILAGAGSGKTRVLTTRIAWLLQTNQVSPSGILGVTFTNKAAKEMLSRLGGMLPINTRGMWVGTFHGLCNRLLRAHHRDAGLLPQFQILDTQDQLAAIKRLLKTLNIDTEKYEPRRLQAFINMNKEAGLRADKVEAWDPFSRKLVELYGEYDAQCNREGVVDFAELLLRSVELLSRNEMLRDHYQSRFQHVLVDEFQDTSRLQYVWLKLLSGPSSQAFAVGDDDQSIYAFRGADTGNMRLFMQDLGIETPIKLTQNYRSHSAILDAANAVIANNENRIGKDLWTDAGAGEPIRLYEAYNDIEEAQFVAEEIQHQHREGLSHADIAVLYRSNAQSRALEHALFSAGIPYRVYGGVRFFERAEIKHALAYLRLVANTEDDNAFLRVVNFPARGVGARTLESLTAAAQQSGCSLWQAACTHFSGKKGLSHFVQLIESLRSMGQDLPLYEQAERIVEDSGLIAHYTSERDGEERIENLRELSNAARAFSIESDNQSLIDFLAHASLEAGEHAAAAGQDAAQLMSIHAAKGLEFKTVFLTGMEEGLFPHENTISEPGGIEEERRLMYVAITRARSRLFITNAQIRYLHGQPRPGMPSRFIGEIPGHLIKSLKLGRVAIGYKTSASNDQPISLRIVTHPAHSHSNLPFPIGSCVQHTRYGQGTVTGYQGNDKEQEIRVVFPKVGDKWLFLEYAKLTPC